MKKIKATAKKIIALLLCLLIAVGTVVPALAEGPIVKPKWKWNLNGQRELVNARDYFSSGGNSSVMYSFLPQTAVVDFFKKLDDKDQTYVRGLMNNKEEKLDWLLNYLWGTANKQIRKERDATMHLSTYLKSYFNTGMKVVQGVSAVLSLVTSTISILKAFGIIENKEATSMGEQLDNIIRDVQKLQETVDEINRKTDEIQNTLTNEFADIDLRLQQQDYLHYKDDVWAKFYSDAVVPLNTLQGRYSDNVNTLIINYVEQWQSGNNKTDLRSLFGRNDEGELIQVFSGNNLNGAGKRLNAAPKISMDEIQVDYAVTLPAEYICNNIDKTENINSDTSIDVLTEAVEKGVYAAAQDGKLTAYRGFYDEWKAYTDEEKKAEAKSLAAYLADTVAFAAAYDAANEKSFASSVKTAYQNFSLWLMGNDSLTSPLIAQFKMLSLTHAFEGEIIDQMNEIAYYICMMNLNFSAFAEMVISMSKAHNDDDSLDIRDLYIMSENNMSVDYSDFITGNPNYCYQAEKVLEYKPAVVESTVSFIYDKPRYEEHPNTAVWFDGNVSRTDWQLYEKDGNYNSRDEKAKSQNDLLSRSITTIDAKIIYAMYITSGFDGSFGEYLASNKVINDADKVTDKVLTSFTTTTLDLRKSTDLTCHWAAGAGAYEGKKYENGKEYSVPDDKLKDTGKYYVHDKATGGVFNMVTGSSDENALVACRAFYGDDYYIYAFSNTDYSFTKKEITDSERLMKLNLLDRTVNNYVYDATGTYSSDYGMFVSADVGTYTFPAGTKEIPDNYFPSSSMIQKLIFDGTPDTIAENAFEGVGSKTYRCLLQAPFVTGSLAGTWHGGYFGDVEVTLDANDGTGTSEKVVAVSGAPILNILNPFDEEKRTFLGWSRYPNGSVVNSNEKINLTGIRSDDVTLYAVWKYDHEHDFEVTKEAVAATCTKDGSAEEKTCKICGYVEHEVLPATGHACTYTKSGDNYIAKCEKCDYEATLYPKEFGYHTVWSEDKDGSGIILMGGTGGPVGSNATCIADDGVYVIQSNDPNNQYDKQRLIVNNGLNVNICLDGLKIKGGYGYVGFDTGKSNVHLTLKGENSITTNNSDSFVSAGNLTIDGDGSLLITGNYDDNPYYTPGVPFNTTGAHTVIKGGNICAMGGDIFSVMINDDVTGGDMVIEKNACFYAEKGIDANPVNGAGERVYPVIIDNPDEITIAVDARRFPFKVLPGRTDACVYLTHGKHDVRVVGGENIYTDNPEIGASVLEKQYGDFTVINPNNDPNAVSYFNGVLSVKKSTPITIKNTNPAIATRNRISILPRTDANITLAGVNINDNISSPISISRGTDDAGNVTITLAKDTENTVYGANAGIELGGKNGSLTIDGEGTLIASGSGNSAAIGSGKNKAVSNITINGGTIYARLSDFGSGAAAIGSGKIEAGASIDSGYAVNNITINGGTVYAGSDFAPAVGAGVCEKKLPVNSITVNGGMLIADSNYGEYTIGGEETKEVVINGGVVTAKSSTEGKGGIAASKTVIENMASVKATRVTGPVNGNGKSVSLNTVTVNEGKNVIIDGVPFPYTSHNGENKVYIYLARTEKIDYTPRIKVIESERGTVTYSPKVPRAGDRVTLNALENEGYSFGKFTISPEIEIDEDNSFIMPDEPVTIGAEFNRIGKITVKDCVNGTIIPSKTSAPSGETITLCVIPDEGMVLSTLTVSPESAVLTGRKFVMPEEDVTVSCTCVPGDYTVTWNVNGKKTTDTVKFGAPIKAPEDPKMEGYDFIGWTPDIAATMPAEDVEYFAVFVSDSYIAEFKAGSKTVAKVPYTMGDKVIEEPSVPEKVGYSCKWEAYTLTAGGITVNAVYTPIEYKARFVANGELVKSVAYTMETVSITEPAVPEKSGYTGTWSDYALTVGGITVKAVYTPAVHEHTFDTKYSSNDAAHWFASTCDHDVVSGLAAHTFGEGVVEGNVTKYTCTRCKYVKTVTNAGEDTKELEAIISDAQSAVDKAAADGDDAVRKYADETKTAIGKLTSGSEVTKKLAEAIDTINKMKTQKAASDALDTLNSVTASTSKGKSIVRMAKLLVNEAGSPEEIDAILTDALTKLEAEESAEAEITGMKTAAKEAVTEKAGEKLSDEMKSIVADIEAVIDAAQTAKQVAAAKELGIACVQTQLDKEKADASLEKAKTSLTEAQTSLTEKAEALKTAQNKLKEANEALEQAKKDLKEAKDDIKAKTEALESAEENLSKAQKELNETKNNLTEKTNALIEAQKELKEANEALKKANEQVEALTVNLKKAQDELTETNIALNEVKSSLELAESEKAALKKQLEDKEKELEALKKSAEAKDEEIAALEKSVSELENQIKEKDNEISEKENIIGNLEKSISNLEASVRTKETEVAQKTEEIKNLENNVENLKTEVTNAQKDIANKNLQIEELTEKLHEAQAEIEELKKETAGHDDVCSKCGKNHKDNFWGRIVCFFNRIGNFFRNLFKRIFK